MKDTKIEYEGELYRKSSNRAGYDIVMNETIIIPVGFIKKIKTNIRFPNGIKDNFALITLRSSYQDSGLYMPGIGILDSNYRDYIFVTVGNLSYKSFKIEKGERFAQIVFIKNNDIILIGED